MSKIFDLINELCPQGVEFRELGEIGYFYGGLNGKTKDDFVKHGNVKYITYMNVFSNLSIDLNALEFVKIENNERQNLVATAMYYLQARLKLETNVDFHLFLLKNQKNQFI